MADEADESERLTRDIKLIFPPGTSSVDDDRDFAFISNRSVVLAASLEDDAIRVKRKGEEEEWEKKEREKEKEKEKEKERERERVSFSFFCVMQIRFGCNDTPALRHRSCVNYKSKQVFTN